MDRKSASRIQRATSKQNNGITPKNSFAARAMRAAYKNEPMTETYQHSLANLCYKMGLFALGVTASAAAVIYVNSKYANSIK